MKWWNLLTEGVFFLLSGGLITNTVMKAYIDKHKKNKDDE